MVCAGLAVLGESPAVGSLVLSLAAAVRIRPANRSRALDLALLVAAGGALIPLCRVMPPRSAASLSLIAASLALLLLASAVEAQPERRPRQALRVLQFAVVAGGAVPLLFDSAPAVSLVPASAALGGALLCPKRLAADPSRLGRMGPAAFAALACITALVAAESGGFAAAAGAVCTALLLLRGIELESRRDREGLESFCRHARLTSLLENIEEAICASDLSGRLTFVNRRFLRLFGLRATFGGRFSDLLSPSDAESFDRQLRTCIETGRPVGGVRYQVRRPDGRIVPIECTVALVKTGGLAIGLQASLRDVSQEQLIEESQRALAQRLESFVETMPLGCVVWDPAFRVLEWNAAAERIFGWPAVEVLGLRYDGFLTAEEEDPLVRDWGDLLAGRQVTVRTCRNRAKDGRIVDCEWIHTTLRDSRGEVTAVASMVRDVSEQHRLERQLRAAQKLEAVGTLAGGVAHDFNNLLTIILGNVALARMSLGPDHAAGSALENAQTAAERAAELIRRLLGFSRRDSTGLRAVRLQDRLAETASLFRYGLGDQVDFEVEIASDLAAVRADLDQVGRVVMNLLRNARDAAGARGKLRLTAENVVFDRDGCRSRPWARPGCFVALAVSDDGPGIDELTRERLFEPFFTTKEVGKGTGLGLAAVYGIVESHGGGIEVESKPGEGAVFTVYLPAASSEGQSRERAASPNVPRARVLLG